MEMKDKLRKKFNLKENSRLEYIDIAKGIGIVLVVFGHVVFEENYPIMNATFVSNFIYSFHMPLFFVISGLCIKNAKKLDRDTVLKLAKAYLVPYVIWSIIYLLAFQVIAIFTSKPCVLSLENYQFTRAISLCGVAPLWFLLALFISEILFLLIKPVLKNGGGGTA